MEVNRICLETSSIIGFVKGEPDCQPVEQLLTLAETGEVEIFVSDFAWKEAYKPLDELGNSRKELVRRVAKALAKVARLGEWELGLDVLGHDNSAELEHSLSIANQPDKEQFLSYAALGLDFFVTKDNHFLRSHVRNKFREEYGFQVGNAKECMDWVNKRQSS